MKFLFNRAISILAVFSLSGAQEPETAIKVDVDVVNVLCTVHDHRGALVRDLKQDDFKIFEDGRPQQMKSAPPRSSWSKCFGQMTGRCW
ncbi:MAG: hypothetical protein ABSE86_39460 [Bryobacteraceae bacterium]